MNYDFSWTTYVTPTEYAHIHHTPVYVILSQIRDGKLPYVVDDDGIKIKMVYHL